MIEAVPALSDMRRRIHVYLDDSMEIPSVTGYNLSATKSTTRVAKLQYFLPIFFMFKLTIGDGLCMM